MPGAVARTATQALNNVTLPYVARLAERGWRQALSNDLGFAQGLNISAGEIRHPAVAEGAGIETD
jgi:alanine dehydrogenase